MTGEEENCPPNEEDFSTDTDQPCVLGPDGRCIRWLHIHYYPEANDA